MLHHSRAITSFIKLPLILVSICIIALSLYISTTNANTFPTIEHSTINNVQPKARADTRFGNLFSLLKQTSRQGVGFLSNLTASIPFTKIFLSGGAVLSLFLIFVRMLIVLGPILFLGALTRESTDATDFLKMLIDFYNQVVVTAIDDQGS